jgi:hypothetical protein
MRAVFACLSLSVVVAACGGPLYAPCDGTNCAEGLRCVDLGGDQQICTKPCTVVKKRAGYPDGFNDDTLFEDGSSGENPVDDPACADAAVTVTSQDNANEGAQNILVESTGAVGVCRVSPEQLADNSISGDSELSGFCAPL